MSMKESEIDIQIEELQEKKIEIHLENEKKRIKNLKCVDCKTKLRVKPEDVMQKGTVKKSYECPKCGLFNQITITYWDSPEHSEADIKVLRRGFGWNVLKPSKMKDEHVKKWVEDENRKIMENKSQGFRRHEKIIIRALHLALNKK